MKKLIIVILMLMTMSPLLVGACSPITPSYGVHVIIEDYESPDVYEFKIYVKVEEIEDNVNSLKDNDGEWIDIVQYFDGTYGVTDSYVGLEYYDDIFYYNEFSSFRVEIYKEGIQISDTVTFHGDLITVDENPDFTYKIYYNVENDYFRIEEDEFSPGNCGTAMFLGTMGVIAAVLAIAVPSLIIGVLFLNSEHRLDYEENNDRLQKSILLATNFIVAAMYLFFMQTPLYLYLIPIIIVVAKYGYVYTKTTSFNRKYLIYTILIIVWPVFLRLIIESLIG